MFWFVFLTPETLFPHRFSNSLTPAGSPALWFGSDTDHLVPAQTPQGKGPQDCPPTSDAGYEQVPQASPHFCHPADYKFVGSHETPLKVYDSLD